MIQTNISGALMLKAWCQIYSKSKNAFNLAPISVKKSTPASLKAPLSKPSGTQPNLW